MGSILAFLERNDEALKEFMPPSGSAAMFPIRLR